MNLIVISTLSAGCSGPSAKTQTLEVNSIVGTSSTIFTRRGAARVSYEIKKKSLSAAAAAFMRIMEAI